MSDGGNYHTGKVDEWCLSYALEAYQHGWIDMDGDTRPGHSFDFSEKTYEIIKQALLEAANIKAD